MLIRIAGPTGLESESLANAKLRLRFVHSFIQET